MSKDRVERRPGSKRAISRSTAIFGHSSSGPEHAKWSPVLREFLAPLLARLN